jgi:DNA-binding response OmpR family regulator
VILQSDRTRPFDAAPPARGGLDPIIRVLLVDDEPAVLWTAEQALRLEGFATATAFDASDALRAAERFGPIDLLITSFYMPTVNGMELAAQLRRHEPMLKVLYLIAHGDQLLPRQLLLSADEAIITTPCSSRELLEAVHRLLRPPRPLDHTSP